MKPSHEAMEKVLGTPFWVVRRFRTGARGDVLFHCEARYPGREDYSFLGMGYNGCGIVARYNEYGDIESSAMTLDEAREITVFPDKT